MNPTTIPSRPTRRVFPLRLALLASLLGFATPALAYLDPSTGSMILSAVIGMFATAGLALKTYWYRLKGLFRGRRADSARQSPQGGAGERGQGRPAD